MLTVGDRFAHYKIEGLLGRGGMGEVYRAFDTSLHRRVALKLLLVQDAKTEAERADATARMIREARAAAALDHPNKVGVFELGDVDGVPYIAMEYIAGATLRERMNDASVSLSQKVAWLCDVARALDAAHAAEIIHRDVKPDNVMVREDGLVKVLDFGIARRSAQPVDPIAATAGPAIPTLTGEGIVIGTAAYMPPEQMHGRTLDGRADQFAWAVMAFEVITGQHPWGATGHPIVLVGAMLTKPPRALRDLVPDAPQALADAIARALSADRDDRFPRMAHVLAALAPVVTGEQPVSAIAPTVPVSSAHIALAAVSAATDPSASLVTAPAESVPRVASATALVRRYRVVHAMILALGLASILAVGYAGAARHDAREWVLMGGVSQWSVVIAALVGAVGLVPLATRRANTAGASVTGFWVALLPAFFGAFGTYMGWLMMLRKLGDNPGTNAAMRFSAGTYEANANRFLGFSLSAVLFVSLAAMPGLSGAGIATTTLTRAPGVRRLEAAAATVALVALAVVAAVLDISSAALVAGVGATLMALDLVLPTVHPETAARDDAERTAAGIIALGLAFAVGLTRIEARQEALWFESPTRAARVAEILAARDEHTMTVVVALVAVLVVVSVDAVRLGRLWTARGLRAPRAPAAALIVVVILAAIGDAGQHARFTERSAELRADLARQFDLFAHLDPPAGDALDAKAFAPHRATALQVATEVVAVDGKGVLRLAALESADGVAHLTSDLDRALASAAVDAQTASDVHLSLSVDRGVRGDALERVLRIAKGAGVKRAELLLTRGQSPALPAQAPAEVRVVLPGDFVALPVELADDGIPIDHAKTFGDLAAALVEKAIATAGPVRLSVRGTAASERADAKANATSPAVLYPCGDTKRAFAAPPDISRCSADAVSWCSTTGAVLACCAKGLVPVGSEGACGCAQAAPGDDTARHASCPAAALPALSTDLIVKAVQARFGELRACYERGLGRAPRIQGKVTVAFEIAPTGDVFEARIREATLPDAESQACMLAIFRSIHFPQAAGPVAVSFPVNFAKEEDEH